MFIHFDSASTMQLDPSNYCKFMLALGYTASDFLAIAAAMNGSAAPADLHQCDAWLANMYRNIPLDHSMATRKFPTAAPDDGGYYETLQPPAPWDENGMPMLSRLGFEQLFCYLALMQPDDLFQQLNHLLWQLPRLLDPETGNAFLEQQVPRECFPAVPDPMVEEATRKAKIEEVAREQEETLQLQMQIMRQQQIEQMQMEIQRRNHDQLMAGLQANALASSRAHLASVGGWTTDSSGRRYYVEGSIR
ncbi:hypothetical protein BCR34DRAFT_646268 [Clohesyomyces aquaticus]|uniref:DUF7514 domain-containing protein n=1 Tax=Clohesyomyces aquaticus TaxID=1231657 RepID=A0A1Y1Y7D6_9PLEO|nr:hypothetical protein BCR34DRAFT_646268 [Clohesyomyces aquaticus]